MAQRRQQGEHRHGLASSHTLTRVTFHRGRVLLSFRNGEPFPHGLIILMYIYMCILMYIHMYIHMYIYVYIHMYKYMYLHLYDVHFACTSRCTFRCTLHVRTRVH